MARPAATGLGVVVDQLVHELAKLDPLVRTPFGGIAVETPEIIGAQLAVARGWAPDAHVWRPVA